MKYNFEIKDKIINNLLQVIELLVERGVNFSYNGFTSTILVKTNKEVVVSEIQRFAQAQDMQIIE